MRSDSIAIHKGHHFFQSGAIHIDKCNPLRSDLLDTHNHENISSYLASGNNGRATANARMLVSLHHDIVCIRKTYDVRRYLLYVFLDNVASTHE